MAADAGAAHPRQRFPRRYGGWLMVRWMPMEIDNSSGELKVNMPADAEIARASSR